MNNGGAYNNQQWQQSTSVTNGSTIYPSMYPQQQVYAPPPIWHTFHPCGHQVKLETGQPTPMRCTVCPPPEYDNHTYPNCGHAHSYQKGTAIPAECPVCTAAAYSNAQQEKAAIAEREAAEAKCREDDKDLRVWLDREVSRVATGAAL